MALNFLSSSFSRTSRFHALDLKAMCAENRKLQQRNDKVQCDFSARFLVIFLAIVFSFFSLTSFQALAQQEQQTQSTQEISVSTSELNLPENDQSIDLQQGRKLLPANLSTKFYRQALFFYFQDQPQLALNQLQFNRENFASIPTRESLFQAGLQISQGLHQNAKTLLTELANKHKQGRLLSNTGTELQQNLVASEQQKAALSSTVFLQLAEQKIAALDFDGAKAILASIDTIPPQSLPQYYLMQQLISWPNQPEVSSFRLNAQAKSQLKVLIEQPESVASLGISQTPYILLNQALSALELQQFALAEQKLIQILDFDWQVNPTTFWQKLFDESRTLAGDQITANEKQATDEQPTPEQIIEHEQLNEQQAVAQYVQLLLAQLFVEQEQFSKAFELLESFPKDTPFSEQALFLFGYSAYQLGKHGASDVILMTLSERYPYGELNQQAWLLSAQQLQQQNLLNQALERHLTIEAIYTSNQQLLADFSVEVEQQTDLLSFYRQLMTTNPDTANLDTAEQVGFPLWLKLSLTYQDIGVFYQQLQILEVIEHQLQQLQEKSRWLKQTISLNQTRHQNIKTKQQNNLNQEILTALAEQITRLAELLAQAKLAGDGKVFANEVENKLLTRVENSHNALAFIQTSAHQQSKKKQRATKAYQKRLARVEGVLSWQLHQEFPQRYWQVKHAFNKLEREYGTSLKQSNKVKALLAKQNNLNNLIAKHQQINHTITALFQQIKGLKHRVQQNIFSQTKQFISSEQNNIEQFLLLNQRAMASVIEQLNQQEVF